MPRSSLGWAAVTISAVCALDANAGAPGAPMRYGPPKVVDATVDLVSISPDGVMTFRGSAKAVLTDLEHVELKFEIGPLYEAVGKIRNYKGRLARGKTVRLTCKVKFKGQPREVPIGFHVSHDFPRAAAEAYVRAHPRDYPSDTEREHLLERIAGLEGTRDTVGALGWPPKP